MIRWEGGPPAARDRRTGPPRRPRGVPATSPYYAGPNYGDFTPTRTAATTASSPIAGMTPAQAVRGLGLSRNQLASMGTPALQQLAGVLSEQTGGPVEQILNKLQKGNKPSLKQVVNRLGLDPAQAAMAGPAIKAARKTGVPASLLMALSGQESAFGTNQGPSSAGARGVTQFIPSTRQAMIDKYGVDPWANAESGMLAAGLYLKELGFKQDPNAALSSYSGGYAESAYNNPILQSAQNFRKLDKAANIKGLKIPRQLETSELFYDPGISIKDGQQIGAIGGHGTHVHFASTNPRDVLRAAKIAQRFGATVGENPAFQGGQVETTGHTGGSYHYRNMNIGNRLQGSRLYNRVGATGNTVGQAIDISGGNLARINQRLAALSGAPTGGPAPYSTGGGAVMAGGTPYYPIGGPGTGREAGLTRAQQKARTGGYDPLTSALPTFGAPQQTILTDALTGSAGDILARMDEEAQANPLRSQPRLRVRRIGF